MSRSTAAPAADVAARTQARVVDRRQPTVRVVGGSGNALALRKAIAVVAPTRASVLVTGETGTGKGLVARQLHELSGERHFVHVDCASLSPALIESELFGHERGAFTGAGERRVGRLERAGTGTIFLDEIAELEPRLQSKLLRVLEDRVFERVGGSEPLAFGARIVAATNRDLAREIAHGRFRADLYYRLQVVELRVPPLRARKQDLPDLVRELAARLGCRPVVESEFLGRLGQHEWPGNVRELANLVERLSLYDPHGPWRASHLEAAWPPVPDVSTQSGESRRLQFAERERVALLEVLSAHRWNVSAAARSLGVSRGALRGRLAKLGL